MSIVYQAGTRSNQGQRGLSGAPVRRIGVATGGEVVYVDANGDVVRGDGTIFTGSFRDDATARWYTSTDGKARPAGMTGMLGGGGAAAGTTTTRKKCCNCVTSDVDENWYLTATRRTAKDVAVQITRRKTVCEDPNSQVKINCNGLKTAAGLQGLGSLGCGCDARM